MKQKLIFCSAFLSNPDYIILDEPMVWLDPQSQKIVKDIIKDLTSNFGIKILLSTHQISTAKEISTKIWIIHNGELKTILNNNDKLKTEDIENEFLRITWDYKKDYIKRIRS
jgi:ABC-type multidrug transport system ATPase subunit